MLPPSLPHALHVDTYLPPPPNNSYNLILSPLDHKAERNPADSNCNSLLSFVLSSLDVFPSIQVVKQLRLPLALVVELDVLLVGILPVYSYSVYVLYVCLKVFRLRRVAGNVSIVL